MDKIFGQDTKTKKLFFSYLKKINLISTDDLIDNQNYTIFFKSITNDFLLQKLNTDKYSILLEKLWITLNNNVNTRPAQITDIAKLGGELNWYLRNSPVKAGEFLKKILDFYKSLNTNN